MLGYIFCLKNTAIPAQVIKITKPLTNNKHLRVLYFWSVSNFEFGFRNTLAPLCVLVLHPVQWILLTTYHVFARKTKCTFLLVILHFIMTMGPFFVFLQKHQNIGLNWSLIGHTYFLSIWFSIVQIKNTKGHIKENST